MPVVAQIEQVPILGLLGFNPAPLPQPAAWRRTGSIRVSGPIHPSILHFVRVPRRAGDCWVFTERGFGWCAGLWVLGGVATFLPLAFAGLVIPVAGWSTPTLQLAWAAAQIGGFGLPLLAAAGFRCAIPRRLTVRVIGGGPPGGVTDEMVASLTINRVCYGAYATSYALCIWTPDSHMVLANALTQEALTSQAGPLPAELLLHAERGSDISVPLLSLFGVRSILQGVRRMWLDLGTNTEGAEGRGGD